MTKPLPDSDTFAFEDSLLVIPRRTPRLFLLNPTARLAWERLAEGMAPRQVADQLATVYGVPLARVRADVAAILTEWRTHGLLARGQTEEEAVEPSTEIDLVLPRAWRERVYRLCGAPVCLRYSGATTEGLLHPLIAHAETSGKAIGVVDLIETSDGYLVVCNGRDIERAATGEDALGQALGRILELSYPEAEWLAGMHAAAVGNPDGAVIIAGDSGSGKSTLTAALVNAGLSYFSDDVVPLDATLRIRPMPFGISLKEGSWSVLAPIYPELKNLKIYDRPRRRYLPVSCDRYGPEAGLVVKALIFPRYQPGRPTVLRRLSNLQSLERLTRARSWMALNGRSFSKTLEWIEATPAFELDHGSLEESVDTVRKVLRGEGHVP